MEYVAEILRGWPADGARERLEQVQQGAVLVNGDVVSLQADGTVNKVGSTKSKRVGLVIRGNGDSGSAANANGRFATPQPAKTISAQSWTTGVVSVTVSGHGYATGNIVAIAGVTPAGYNGSFVITVVDANTFTYALASNPGSVTVQGTSTQSSVYNTSGKAVVLWGNYIVRTTNFAAASYVPGSPVTAVNGKFALAAGQGNADGTYTVTATNTIDPEVGFVLRVQGASATETASLVISVF